MEDKIKEFVEYIRTNSPKDAVAFTLFVNSSEYQTEYRHEKATSDSSWRNLNGKWVD